MLPLTQLKTALCRAQCCLPALLVALALSSGTALAQDASLGSSKEQREAFDAKNLELQQSNKVNAMLQEKRDRRNAQLKTDTMTPEVRAAWDRYEKKSYPSTPVGKQQAERDFLMLESNWGAVQAEAHKGTIRPVDATRFSQQHKEAMSIRGDIAAKQVDSSLEVEPAPAQSNAKDKPYSDHDGQLSGAVIDGKGNRAPLTAQQAADTRTQFDKNVNKDLRKHGLPELENPSATMKTDAMANTNDPRVHRASAEHQNRLGGTVYQDPVAKDMELKNQKYDADGISEAQKSSAMDKARYANEQGRQQDIHRRKQDREMARGLELVNDNPDTNSPKHKAGLEALQNSQAQGDYGAKYTDRLNKTVEQASKNAKTDHGVDTSVSPKLEASVNKLKKDRTVNATVESATAAATYENNQANKRSEGAQIFAQDGEHKAAAEMIRNADANTKGHTIEKVRVGAAQRKEAELLSGGMDAGEAKRQAQRYGDAEAGKLASEMRSNSKRDVLDPTHDNFELNSKELADTQPADQPDTKSRVFGAAKLGMDATIAVGTGVKATNDYIEGSEAEALANESQARFDAINNKKGELSKAEIDQALAESNETLKQRTKAEKKGEAAKGAVAFGGQMAGMVAGEATEAASAAVGVALDSYEAGGSAYKAADAHNREQRLRAKAAELNAKGLTEQAQKFTDRADRERETKLTELEKSAASAGKTGLGVVGAAGAGTAMQAGATVAALPTAAVAGAAAGAFGSGYGATRTVIDNTKAGKALENAKADFIAGQDEKVIAVEGAAVSQHERVKATYERALADGKLTFSEGFDRQSFESAMSTAKETGRYGYVRDMMERAPIDKPAPAITEVGRSQPEQGFTGAAQDGVSPRHPEIGERAVTDLRDMGGSNDMEDYRQFDPAENRPDVRKPHPVADNRSVGDLRDVEPIVDMEDYRGFDPAASGAASLDDELASLVQEMEDSHNRATRTLDAERRSGSVSRSSASLERSSATRKATSQTQQIQVASAQAVAESQRSLHAQADRITQEQNARTAAQEQQRAEDQQRFERGQQQAAMPDIFGGSTDGSSSNTGQARSSGSSQPSGAGYSAPGGGSTSSGGGYSSASGRPQTAANTAGLSAACKESQALARQMAELESRARSGDQDALRQFQSLAKRAPSVQSACQRSVPTLNVPDDFESGPAYEGDDCGPVIFGIPKTKEECDRYKAAQ